MTQTQHLGSLAKRFGVIAIVLMIAIFVLKTASRDRSTTYTKMYTATGIGATPKESRADVRAKIERFVDTYDDNTPGVVTEVKQEPESWNGLELTVRFRMLIDRSREPR